MELSTVRRLAELNRDFYERHAENFADARPRLQLGARRVLATIAPGARVLELGCGDGKVARALPQAQYVGVDQSAAMLERAARFMPAMSPPASLHAAAPDAVREAVASVVLIQADLLDPAWPACLPSQAFDQILAFAVFHHLPGLTARERLLRQLAELLAPGGRFVMSNWQVARSDRLLGRRVPWDQAGLSDSDVEPGDALLSWERGGRRGLRYVHALDVSEARSMADSADLRITETFASDGASGDLSDYVTMRRDFKSKTQPDFPAPEPGAPA